MLRRIAKKLKTKLKEHLEPQKSEPEEPEETKEEILDREEETVPELEVDEKVLDDWVKEGKAFTLIDIREPYEIMQGHLTGAWMIPMNQIPERIDSLPKDKTLVLYCAAGIRSFDVSYYLRKNGFEDVWSLDGGVAAWAQQGYSHPWDESEWTLSWVAELTEKAAKERGLKQEPGTIQEIRKTEEGVLHTLGIFEEGGLRLVTGLKSDELQRPKP